MDGVAFVREQMARRPVADRHHQHRRRGGRAGAGGARRRRGRLRAEADGARHREADGHGEELVEKVKAAALAPRRAVARRRRARRRPPIARRRRRAAPFDIVVIGISTGGPQALKLIMPQLPADFPVPVAMVLHMPLGYTEMYAQKLDEMSAAPRRRSRRRARRSSAGMAFLAPAGRHLTLPARRRRRAAPTSTSGRSTRRTGPSVDVAVPVGGRRLRRARPRRRHDRDGLRRPRRRGVDQGARGQYPYRGRGELRRLRDAAVGRRGRAERRRGPARPHGRRRSWSGYERQGPARRRLGAGAAQHSPHPRGGRATRSSRRRTACPRWSASRSRSRTWCCSTW